MEFKKGDRVALMPEGLYDVEQRGAVRNIGYGEWCRLILAGNFRGMAGLFTLTELEN